MGENRLNNYEIIAESYRETAEKPDKQYSTLPTVLRLAENFENKTVLDLGCGEGFFAEACVNNGAKKVVGIDNSAEQIKLAKQNKSTQVEYLLGDVFKDQLPKADIVIAAYLVNYSEDTEQLKSLFQNIYNSLNAEGKLVAVLDLPEKGDLKKFGAVKTLLGDKVDGTKIQIELFKNEKSICVLNAVYFTPETLQKTLTSVGFKEVKWYKPTVSEEGKKKMGESFWEGYTDNCELGYLTAQK